MMERWKNRCQRYVALLALLCCLAGPALGQSIPLVTMAETSDADQLNPFTNFSATGSYVNEYLYQSLIRTDKKTGEFMPLLADGLPQVSDDHLSYTYSLHPLAKFNNGKKVTSRDVIFSLKMQRNQFVNNNQKRSHYEAIVEVVGLNEQLVMFKMAKPNSQSMRITGEFAILSEDFFDPEHRLDSVSLAEELQGDKMSMAKLQALKTVAERVNVFGSSLATYNAEATTGSYILQSWRRGGEIVLTANKRFWGKKLESVPNDFFKQNVAEIRIEVTSDELVLRKGIFDNRYDLVSSTPYSLFANLSEMPAITKNYKFVSPPGPSYEYIGMNMRAAARQRNLALGDLAVRKALANLVHVDLLMVEVCYSLGIRIASDCPASHPDYRQNMPVVPFDIATAGAALDRAGWIDTDGNGLRDKQINGEDVQMVLECIYNENKPERKKIAEHLQTNARELGILLTVTELPWKDYLGRLKSGDFDLYVGAWVADPNEDSYRQIWHSKSWGRGSNFVGFGNVTTDKLVVAYEESLEPEAHKAASQAMQKAIYDQQPYIFLWTNNNCLVLNQRYRQAPIYDLRPGFWIASWE